MTSASKRITRPAPVAATIPQTQPSIAHQRILIVEDHEDTGTAIRSMLEMASGVPVDLVTNGSRALEHLKERPYSVAIIDLRMPQLTGMELLREIQANQLNVTVIVTTGFGSINEAVEAMRFGAYDFLTKPIEPEHLCLLVQLRPEGTLAPG